MSRPYSIVGATGGQGGAVVDALLLRDMPVRAVVRRESAGAERLRARGAEIVVADITDRTSTAKAFADSEGAFVMTTPFEDGTAAEAAQGAALVDALTTAQVPHVVFSSVADADKNTGIPHFESKLETENLLRASGVSFTIVGPTYFYDNLLGGLDRIRSGHLDVPLPLDTPLQQLSRRDLGRFVALVLADPTNFESRRIDLASDAPTLRQMAASLSDVFHRPVQPVPGRAESISSPDMRAMFQFLTDTGYDADISSLRENYPEVEWQTFAQWSAGIS